MRAVRIAEGYELRRLDGRNWQLWERRLVKSGKREGQVAWMPCDAYFGSVRAAVEHVAADAERNRFVNVEADLRGALGIMRQIERDIGRHAGRFEQAMAGRPPETPAASSAE